MESKKKDFELSDEIFGKIMDKEDEMHFNEMLAENVPLETAKINDFVQFGKIVWKVIGVDNGKKLLLSKECMGMDFDWKFAQDDSNESAKSSLSDELEGILNGDESIDYAQKYDEIKKYFAEWFCHNYFSKDELEKIVPCGTETLTSKGALVNDQVFILSKSEVMQYIPIEQNRIASMHVMFNDVTRPWIIRHGDLAEYQLAVDEEGEIVRVPDGYMCCWFRPAVWVKIGN